MSLSRARHALPDADQVVALPAVRTATTPPAWEDQNGHEVLVGHDVSAHFLALDRTEKLMHAVSILVDRTTSKIANVVEFVEAHVDLATRRACPFQPGLAARIDALLDEHRRLGWEFPLSGNMGLRLSEPARERR